MGWNDGIGGLLGSGHIRDIRNGPGRAMLREAVKKMHYGWVFGRRQPAGTTHEPLVPKR